MMNSRKCSQIGFVALSVLISVVSTDSVRAANALSSKAGEAYHEVARFKIGGEGGWDYLTVHDGKLFVARANRISVIDTATGKVIGEVTGLDGAHGTAFDDKLGLAFATSGKSGEVFVFDTQTLAMKGKVKAGGKPDWIYFDPSSGKVFAFNGVSKDVTVIDPRNLKVEKTIALPGKPETAQGDENGHIFVNIEDRSELVKIDSKKLKITDTYALKPCEEPTGLAINQEDKHLFVGCGNQTALTVDSATGKILKVFKVGDGVDATAFDTKRKLAFDSAGEGNLAVIEDGKDGGTVWPLISTVKGARTLAVDSATGKVFLASSEFAPPKAGEAKAHPTSVPGTFFILVLDR